MPIDREIGHTRRARPVVIDFSKCVMPRVIDFGKVYTHREEVAIEERFEETNAMLHERGVEVHFNSWPHPTEDNTLPTKFTMGADGKLIATPKPVPEFRMKRARRILWECRQREDWKYTHASFYRHPSLRNISSIVLKQLVRESQRSHV